MGGVGLLGGCRSEPHCYHNQSETEIFTWDALRKGRTAQATAAAVVVAAVVLIIGHRNSLACGRKGRLNVLGEKTNENPPLGESGQTYLQPSETKI